jgi:2-iminobutanoate/2-iminopropanoate deaminase
MTRAAAAAAALGLALAAAQGCRVSPQRRVVSTPDAPAAIGPYSQAIAVGAAVFVSGQIGLDPRTGALVQGTVADEAHRAMRNVGAILEAAGCSFGDVVQAQVFLADLGDYAAVNEAYGSYFAGGAPPARAAVQVARLPKDARVEIMVVAVRR